MSIKMSIKFEAANGPNVLVFDSANPDFYVAHVDIRQISPDVGPTGLTFTRFHATSIPSSCHQYRLHTWQCKRT